MMAGNKNTCLRWHLASQRLWRRGALCRKAAKLIQHAGQVLLGCFIGCEADIEPTVQFVHNGSAWLYTIPPPWGHVPSSASR